MVVDPILAGPGADREEGRGPRRGIRGRCRAVLLRRAGRSRGRRGPGGALRPRDARGVPGPPCRRAGRGSRPHAANRRRHRCGDGPAGRRRHPDRLQHPRQLGEHGAAAAVERAARRARRRGDHLPAHPGRLRVRRHRAAAGQGPGRTAACLPPARPARALACCVVRRTASACTVARAIWPPSTPSWHPVQHGVWRSSPTQAPARAGCCKRRSRRRSRRWYEGGCAPHEHGPLLPAVGRTHWRPSPRGRSPTAFGSCSAATSTTTSSSCRRPCDETWSRVTSPGCCATRHRASSCWRTCTGRTALPRPARRRALRGRRGGRRAGLATSREKVPAAAELAALELGPLEQSAVAALVADLLGGDPPDDLVAEVVRRSGGNPLYVGELAFAIRDRGPGLSRRRRRARHRRGRPGAGARPGARQRRGPDRRPDRCAPCRAGTGPHHRSRARIPGGRAAGRRGDRSSSASPTPRCPMRWRGCARPAWSPATTSSTRW